MGEWPSLARKDRQARTGGVEGADVEEGGILVWCVLNAKLIMRKLIQLMIRLTGLGILLPCWLACQAWAPGGSRIWVMRGVHYTSRTGQSCTNSHELSLKARRRCGIISHTFGQDHKGDCRYWRSHGALLGQHVSQATRRTPHVYRNTRLESADVGKVTAVDLDELSLHHGATTELQRKEGDRFRSDNGGIRRMNRRTVARLFDGPMAHDY